MSSEQILLMPKLCTYRPFVRGITPVEVMVHEAETTYCIPCTDTPRCVLFVSRRLDKNRTFCQNTCSKGRIQVQLLSAPEGRKIPEIQSHKLARSRTDQATPKTSKSTHQHVNECLGTTGSHRLRQHGAGIKTCQTALLIVAGRYWKPGGKVAETRLHVVVRLEE